MQEVCELAVVTLLVRYKTLYKQLSQSFSRLKEKRELEKNPGDREHVQEMYKIKRKVKRNTTERNTLTEISKETER